MGNLRNKTLVIAIILTLSIVTGCTITTTRTTTRNQYYGCPDQIKDSLKNETGSKHVVDSLTNKKNEQK